MDSVCKQSVGKQINTFLAKCNELKNCKFIMATTKIKDLLKCIVNSPELYELFTTVSSNFNYLEAKKSCLVDLSDGVVNRSYVALPETVGNRLAFVFCLLVEFDKDTINFNWFLQHYFPEDGSYYASYHAFCDCVIVSLERLISDIFSQEISEELCLNAQLSQEKKQVVRSEYNEMSDDCFYDGQRKSIMPQFKNPANSAQLAEYISTITLLVSQEKQFILESAIPDEDKEAGYKMLTEILLAVKDCRPDLIDALVCGYNYYILYNNTISGVVQTLFETIQKYEEIL